MTMSNDALERPRPAGINERVLAAIRRDFPGWNPWRSSTGRYWASRILHRRRPVDADVTWAMTVDADTPDQLREALDAQEARSGPD